jgi:hypothetical protein
VRLASLFKDTHMATYGGQQRDNPGYRYNPQTGEIEYSEGDMIEVSPESEHGSVGMELLQGLPYFAAPFGAMGLEALAGPIGGSIAGSAMGSVPGYTAAPTVAGSTATAGGGLGSATFGGGLAPLASSAAPAAGAAGGAGAAATGFGMNLPTLTGLTNIGAGVFGAINQHNANQDSQENAEANREEQARQYDTTLEQRQNELGVNATQMDPFVQQRARQKQALLAELLKNYSPATWENGKVSGGAGAINASTFAPAMSFFGPQAMQAAEGDFANQVRQASPSYADPNWMGVGYEANPTLPALPAQGAQAQPRSQRQQLVRNLTGGY